MENARRAQQRLVDRGYVLKVDGGFGAKSMAALMSYVGNRADVNDVRLALGKAANTHFGSAALTTPLRIAHALAQQSVETGRFNTLVESLNYSVAGLKNTFSRSRISAVDCDRLGRKPADGPVLSAQRQREIANIVYGGDFGRAQLGNTKPDDGWNFRGRGAKQTTGRTNYGAVKIATGLDVIAKPELLEDPDVGIRAACIFWKEKGCNAFADADDIEGLTKRVNGGTNGLADRKIALSRAKVILL